MIQSFGDIFKIPELKKRVSLTLGLLAVYRLGAVIPVPGINAEALVRIFQAHSNTLLGFLDIFSGGALKRLSIFAMGTMPYINASIIISLLQGAHVIPYLDHLAKEGQSGQKKMNQITRYLTVFLALIQSFGLTTLISRIPLPGDVPVVTNPGPGFVALTVLTLVTGSMFVMWLGEQITESGIGNGISLIIFAGIVEGLPNAIHNMFVDIFQLQQRSLVGALLLVALVLVVTGLVVWLETGQRKVPVQYAKRVVGRRMYGGASTFLPVKVDQSGVIAVIFSVSLLSFPVTIAAFAPEASWAHRLTQMWERGTWWYEVLYASLIVFFCYFYNSVAFNPGEMAENLKKWGGFVPGIRPGEPTAQHLQKIMERVTLGGALAVALLAVLPDYLRRGLNAPFFFGGTSLLIVVGVALDTVGQVEAHLIMRHYEGFTKNARIKGRWFNVGSS
jgi:preprotein translocase subunit SecY